MTKTEYLLVRALDAERRLRAGGYYDLSNMWQGVASELSSGGVHLATSLAAALYESRNMVPPEQSAALR